MFWIQKNLYLCCIQLKACFKYTLKQMLIIGIAGGTGSGKTTVVRKSSKAYRLVKWYYCHKTLTTKTAAMCLWKNGRTSTSTIPTLLSGVFFPDMSPCCAKEKHRTAHLLIPDVYTPARNHPYRPPGSHHHRRYPCLVRQETAKHDGPQDICRR